GGKAYTNAIQEAIHIISEKQAKEIEEEEEIRQLHIQEWKADMEYMLREILTGLSKGGQLNMRMLVRVIYNEDILSLHCLIILYVVDLIFLYVLIFQINMSFYCLLDLSRYIKAGLNCPCVTRQTKPWKDSPNMNFKCYCFKRKVCDFDSIIFSPEFKCDIGMHLCLHPANNTVYKHVCDAQYYADSPVFQLNSLVDSIKFLFSAIENITNEVTKLDPKYCNRSNSR
ncbi:hypothetical protein L9F63_007409, partial [Diploptera punctata]